MSILFCIFVVEKETNKKQMNMETRTNETLSPSRKAWRELAEDWLEVIEELGRDINDGE